MKLIPAKQILSSYSSGSFWFGSNYNMNIYKGCCHGCIYCDSRSDCYHVENFDEVRAKENVLELLNSELSSKRKKGVVGNGAMSDPYNPFEREYELTRGALKLIDFYGFGAGVLTKSDLVLRDMDVLLSIKRHSPVIVKMTITTLDDTLCRKIEPHVTVSSKRFEALSKLSDAGLFTGILMMPLLPFINDTEENVRGIVRRAYESGAKFVYPSFGVTLRMNQRLYFYQQLDTLFKGIRERYIQTFQESYECSSLNADYLYKVFVEECNKYGLLYKNADIISKYKSPYQYEQLSLFDGF